MKFCLQDYPFHNLRLEVVIMKLYVRPCSLCDFPAGVVHSFLKKHILDGNQ